jgi:hypothetical protein
MNCEKTVKLTIKALKRSDTSTIFVERSPRLQRGAVPSHLSEADAVRQQDGAIAIPCPGMMGYNGISMGYIDGIYGI